MARSAATSSRPHQLRSESNGYERQRIALDVTASLCCVVLCCVVLSLMPLHTPRLSCSLLVLYLNRTKCNLLPSFQPAIRLLVTLLYVTYGAFVRAYVCDPSYFWRIRCAKPTSSNEPYDSNSLAGVRSSSLSRFGCRCRWRGRLRGVLDVGSISSSTSPVDSERSGCGGFTSSSSLLPSSSSPKCCIRLRRMLISTNDGRRDGSSCQQSCSSAVSALLLSSTVGSSFSSLRSSSSCRVIKRERERPVRTSKHASIIAFLHETYCFQRIGLNVLCIRRRAAPQLVEQHAE